MTPTEGSGAPPGEVTTRQRKALPLVLAGESLTAGCKAAGITTKTWYTWRKQEPFRRSLAAMEDSVFDAGLSRLKASFLGTVERLLEISRSTEVGVAMQACTMLCRMSIEVADQQDVRRRLAALEAQRGADQK